MSSEAEIAIGAKGLSKSYTIRHRVERHTTLFDELGSRLRQPLRRLGTDTLRALDDVSFEVQRGKVVGVIGPNGAGKSTLLKILARITRPSLGRVEVKGRVGSLLEVGTGFHPELTGRENVYLNGAILGMRRGEIVARFDDIVEFAGIQRFLDTPVKRYSTGMSVRLAFAVAAHLTADILLVDEVLAVGDSEFQKRSLGKIRDLAESGRTVLFVSHSLEAVTSLCDRAIYLRGGRLQRAGPVRETVGTYLADLTSGDPLEEMARRGGSGEIRIRRVSPSNGVFDPAQPKTLRIDLGPSQAAAPFFVTCMVHDEEGRLLLNLDSRTVDTWLEPSPEVRSVDWTISTPWFKPGVYTLSFYLCHALGIYDALEGAARMRVSPILPYRGAVAYAEAGMILADFKVQELPPTTGPSGRRVAMDPHPEGEHEAPMP